MNTTLKPMTSMALALLLTVLSPLHVLAQTWIKAGPYLQELTNDAVTVVFEHHVPSLSWIEMREKGSTAVQRYFQTVDGLILVQQQILDENPVAPVQNFAIRATGLKPHTPYEYRICGRKVIGMNAQGATLSTNPQDCYTSDWTGFSTLDPEQTDHHLFITSDMHNRPDTLRALLQHLDFETIDHFLYNGDMTNYVQTGQKGEEPYTGYIQTSVDLFAKNKAFEMVRGNHDTRGDLSRHFKDYFPQSSGKIYNARRWGDLEVIFLDCGEDKVDSHKEYYGMVSFYQYREEMAEWLRKLIRSEEFRTAKYRIVIGHFPVLRDNQRKDLFDGIPHLSSLILPLLKQCDIDLYVAGHYHPNTYILDGINHNGQGNQFEEYIIGAHTGMRIDIEQGNIKLKIVDTKGHVLLDKVVKEAKADRKTVLLGIQPPPDR